MSLLNVVIDLSHFNEVSSFQKVKDSGIIGVVHKATQGTRFVDDKYADRRTQALSAGLFWGAYHFGTGGNVEDQVNHFLDVVKPDDQTLLVLDFEPNPRGQTMSLAEAESFVQKVNEKIGRFPGLYSGESFINQHLGNNTNTPLKNCFLWIAKFTPGSLPRVPKAFPTFTLFQYTDGIHGDQPHTVPGIVHPCDRDKFNGDEAGLRRLWNH